MAILTVGQHERSVFRRGDGAAMTQNDHVPAHTQCGLCPILDQLDALVQYLISSSKKG